MSASKLNIRFIINLIIVFIVVVVFTFLFEYYLSLVSSKKEPFETRIELAAEKNIFFDRRRRMEVILDIRDNLKFTDRNNYYPIVHPSIFLRRSPLVIEGNEIFPLSSVANVNTVYCNESGEYSIYYSDRFGFNNPPRGEDLKKLDIAVVGDSFANGACVEAGKNAVDNLRKFKPKTLNFGMGGSGPLIEMGIFKEYISQLKPKVLLWFYYEGNDLSDLKKEMREPILTRYHEKKYSQDILNKKRKIDEQLK